LRSDCNQAGSDYSNLSETSRAFVHGRSITGLLPSKDRTLARRVTMGLIDGANGLAGQVARADYLNGLA